MCVGCVRVFVYTCAYVFSTCDDKPFAEWRTTRKSLRVLFCYFFCEKKVEFFFISKTVAPRARARSTLLFRRILTPLLFRVPSEWLCLVVVVWWCCVFAFAYAYAFSSVKVRVLLFFPLCIEKKSSRVCVVPHTNANARASLSLESLFQHVFLFYSCHGGKGGVWWEGQIFLERTKHSLWRYFVLFFLTPTPTYIKKRYIYITTLRSRA